MLEGLPKGKYFIKIKTYNNNSWVPEQYYLTVNFAESNYFEQSPNNSFENATFLELQKEYSANLAHYEDIDYYYFELLSNGNTSINLRHQSTNITNNTNSLWMAYLFSENNTINALHSITLKGNNSPATMLEGLPKGKYFIKIKTYNNNSWVPEQYYLTVNFTNSNYFEQSPNDSFENATEINFNTEYSGNLSSHNDVDYYKFYISNPGKILISMHHDSFNLTHISKIFWTAFLYSEMDKINSVNQIFLKGNDFFSSIETEIDKGNYYVKILCNSSSSWVPDQYFFKIIFNNNIIINGNVTTFVTGLSTPLSNVSIILSNGDISYTTQTSEYGNYNFESIPIGIYNLKLQRKFFSTIIEPAAIVIKADMNAINLQHEMKIDVNECFIYDINSDNKIGIEEAINILQNISKSFD